MNVKNINPFERHVEKIVLAVAAAGAVYLGYLAMQPVVVETDSGESVAVTDVEKQVSKAIEDLQQKRDAAAHQDLTYKLPDFARDYKQVADERPIPVALVNAAVPHFVPLNAPVTAGNVNGVTGMAVVTPKAPAPQNVTATSKREQVLVGAQPGPNGQMVGGQPKDQAWVEVKGEVPLGDMVASMTDPALKNNEKLPPTLQRVVVMKIEVQRRPQLANGEWGPWEDVQPSPASNPVNVPDLTKVAEGDVATVVSSIEQQQKQVLSPSYYAPAPVTPVVNTPAAGGTGAGVNPPDPTVFTNPVDDQLGGPVTPTPAPTPVAPGRPGVGGAAAAKAPPTPFQFFDDSVVPGHTYQYQVRVDYYNPLFHFAMGTKDPNIVNAPLLTSEWVQVPTSVEVLSDLYFYVSAPLGMSGQNPRASIRVYKWTGGQWYRSEWSVQAGQQLAGNVSLLDKKTTMNVETPYSVVDVVPAPNGREQSVILRGPKGELLERMSRVDADDPKQRDLEKIAYKPPVVVTTKPAPRVTPRQTPYTPSGGGNIAPNNPGGHDDQL
jgi:hypothetical protein